MQRSIVLDTLGELHACGFRLFGWCRDCQDKYDKGRRDNRPTHFDIDVAGSPPSVAPIAPWSGSRPSPARGADRETRRRGCCLRDTGAGNGRELGRYLVR